MCCYVGFMQIRMVTTSILVIMQVYYFDGSLECFGTGHVQYGVIAIIVSVLVLIPLPIYVLAVSRNWLKVRRVM